MCYFLSKRLGTFLYKNEMLFVNKTAFSSSEIDGNKLKEYLEKVPIWYFAEQFLENRVVISLEKIKIIY